MFLLVYFLPIFSLFSKIKGRFTHIYRLLNSIREDVSSYLLSKVHAIYLVINIDSYKLAEIIPIKVNFGLPWWRSG